VVLSSFYSYSFKMIRFFLIFPNISALKFKVKLLIMTVPYQSILMQNTFYNSASDVISFFVLGVTSFISFIFNKYSNDTCRLSAFFVDNYFHRFFFHTDTFFGASIHLALLNSCQPNAEGPSSTRN
jgi:hypothetical protein